MVHENSLKNLIPIKPGMTLNPTGRPKAIITKAYRRLMSMKLPPAKDPAELFQIMFNNIIDTDGTYADIMALAQLKEAILGNTRAAAEIADRVEGKALPKIEFDDDQPYIPIDYNFKKLGLVKFRKLKALMDEAKATSETEPLKLPPVNTNGKQKT